MSLKYLPIDSEIPVSISYNLNNELFDFKFQYNSRSEFLTLEISQEETVLFSTKITYGNNIIRGFNRIPFALVPLIEDDLYIDGYSGIKIDLSNFGKTVFIYFNDGV